jgi:RimJ/RimL family protein N-acetyltransferase
MLRKYKDEDFELLEGWVTDPALLFQFAGPGWSYPLTREQIKKHQADYPFKQLYIWEDGMEASAIGEIISNEPHSPRIGRLLIGNPDLRGKGLGEKFLRELISECYRLYGTVSICLFVLEENYNAIRCYEKTGFKKTAEAVPDLLFNQKSFKLIKMVLTPPDLS